MLKRVITGLILAPLFLWALYALPPVAVSVLLGSVFLAAFWEASALVGFTRSVARYLYVSVVAVTGTVIAILILRGEFGSWAIVISAVAVIWWILVPFLLHRFTNTEPGIYGSPTGRGMVATFILLSSWAAIEALYIGDAARPRMLVNLILLIWVADSGAYFSGKYLGTHKLAPIVSPGKTIEGVVGGLIGAAIVASVFARLLLGMDTAQTIIWVAFSMVVTLLSVWGDLNESALKRVAHVKDSGTIIPGHGGFFDRIDAITAAAPVYLLGWYFFQRSILA